jgi:predicted TIM-barrel fold metal-dependent hydrolase
MTVIDVDAHYEPAEDWLDAFPELRSRFPEMLPDTDPRFHLDSAEMFAFFVSDDLLRNVPKDRRMAMDRLTTPAMQALFSDSRESLVYPGANQHKPFLDPAARVAWMDGQGIAIQNVITGAGYTLARAIEDPVLGRDALSAVNTWMADAADGYTDRLMPAVSLRFDDLDWTVKEMTRMRTRGSRFFMISSEPANGIPPNHPDFDVVWAAATDLGMVALLHIGLSPSIIHPGWANTDNPALIRLLSVLQPEQTAEIFLSGMVFGAVFDRHPTLTILLSELGIDWVPRLVERMDSLGSPGVSPLVLGEYRLPLKPGEYIRRNIRVSPLPAPHQSPVGLLERLPEVGVFSSDYPHFEGNPDPIAHYATTLADIDPAVRAAFLGGNIFDAFARMGDPLPVAARREDAAR